MKEKIESISTNAMTTCQNKVTAVGVTEGNASPQLLISSIVDRAATLDPSLQIRLGAILKHHGATLCNADPHTLVNLSVAPNKAIQAANEFLLVVTKIPPVIICTGKAKTGK
jgi:hypothetical protein